MTKSDFHHAPERCDTKCCKPNCNCRYSSWPIWFLYVLFAIFVIASPIIIIISINIWYQTPKPLPSYMIATIEDCASYGSVHPHLRSQPPLPAGHPRRESRNWLRGPGAHPSSDLPNANATVCEEIKKIVHQSIDYCEDCANEDPPPPPPPATPPLVLGGESVAIEITDNPQCAGDVITGITVDNQGGPPNQKTQFTGADLDLPQFCPGSDEFNKGPNNNRRLDTTGQPRADFPTREWELLERPRVHHTRTKPKPLDPDSDEQVGGPYVVFIAKHLDGLCCEKDKNGRRKQVALRDKERITVFVLYLDWVTEQPTIVEFDVEIERGKDIVSVEDTVQLISNVRLNSIRKEITFQIGEGARRIVIAGYDFSALSTNTDIGPRRRSDEDTSGSYRIGLSDDAAVEWVQRVDM